MTHERNGADAGTFSRRDALLTAGAAAIASAAMQPAQAQAPRATVNWKTAWTATLQKQNGGAPLSGQTVRNKTVASIGGSRVRVRLSNEFGAQPLKIGAASVHVDGKTAPLMFGASASTIIPPFAPLLSDPVDIMVKPLDVVLISIYLPEGTSPDTFQRGDNKLSIVTGAGDFTRLPDAPGLEGPVLFLSALEIVPAGRPAGLVILGDTKSAGAGTWPEFLPGEAKGALAVANRSMFAGLMALGSPGDSCLARFDRDVLSVTGVTHMLLFSGNNDLIQPGTQGSNGKAILDASFTQTTEQLIAAQEQAANRARSAGLKVIGGTWLPYDGVSIPGYSAPEKLVKREQVNTWMKKSPLFERVIDFDAALRDPANPKKLLPAYDSGNHFTPSEAGYRKMAATAWAGLKSI